MWMDLEHIMFSEIIWTKTNTVCYHLHVEIKIKWLNVYNKTKQTHRKTENKTGPPTKARGYGKRRHRGIGLRDTNYYA